eukprot:4626799-Pyramimonas_sp.AAC.1
MSTIICIRGVVMPAKPRRALASSRGTAYAPGSLINTIPRQKRGTSSPNWKRCLAMWGGITVTGKLCQLATSWMTSCVHAWGGGSH